MSAHSYRIYPSLLDSFQRFLNAPKEFESIYNEDQDGGYKRSLEEISDELEQRLIESVNRVDRGPIESADKGTVFNELVDYVRTGREVRDGMYIRMVEDCEKPYFEVHFHGFTFAISRELVYATALNLDGSLEQVRCSATLDTAYGPVELYGVIDEIQGDEVIDLKTTARYEFGKFGQGWQKDVYPYCLQESGLMEPYFFTYMVFKWVERKGEPSDAQVYREEYYYDHDEAKVRLRQICERFIEWLEYNRDRITDKKVFGLVEE